MSASELPPEDPNDPFDRQRCVKGWVNERIESQVCFVLGTGGLGCTVAFTLARLGVKKIILLDRDRVETSNLNRQILFSKSDVGREKVYAAADGIKAHIVGNTEVVAVHCDVQKDWATVVKHAKECTVLFNNIDIGGYFDYAVLALAKKLGIPYSAGSSYARTWIVEFYNGSPKLSSFSYVNKSGDAAVFAKLHPNLIMEHQNLEFLPRDPNPPTRTIGSNVLVCSSAGIMTVNMWAQSLMGDEMPNYTKFDIVHFWSPEDILAWPPPEEEDTELANMNKSEVKSD
eukprot:TRINITY_DN5023_c0_g1_i1.p1 TRINITY_DN5023_c0_g1~~TRINITY_DN5023_c0_g1_i1.p1  ORF type:complete len:286 (-),score=70.07 TRINITY_DN5023_c0_g1_i1:27-884(-)